MSSVITKVRKLVPAFVAIASVGLVVGGSVPAAAGAPDRAMQEAPPMPHQPPFVAQVLRINPHTARQMTGVTWEPGCPVPIEDLRVVQMRYWGFDDRAHKGRLVVNSDVADAVVRVFEKIYEARFPIRRMEPVVNYGGSDDASMAADNTSSFNCRPITGTTDRWSIHSYGRAIDINTVENPYVKGSLVLPDAGREFLDRADVRPGMITAGDLVNRAFAAEGFDWGGSWTSLKDFQHFERTP
ncbi:MAG: M15 family metallopeptidase [Nocardioidaceae bacterium]